MNQAPIADFRRLTLHDGPGTRDTVFVKGCPLRCLWCHNPESISPLPQLLFHRRLCTGCGACRLVCPVGLDREKCRNCGRCVEHCFAGARSLCGGRKQSAEEVFQLLLKDREFFRISGGGVTVSGGEPLLYPGFVRELFELLRGESIHTALDTCGEAGFENFEQVLPVTDLILFDLKGMDPAKHRANTGRSNERIHENLKKLGRYQVPVEIRMPVVPGCNDAPEEFHAAGKFLAGLGFPVRVRLLAYHAMAHNKYTAAGLPDPMPQTETPSPELLANRAAILAEYLPDTEILLWR